MDQYSRAKEVERRQQGLLEKREKQEAAFPVEKADKVPPVQEAETNSERMDVMKTFEQEPQAQPVANQIKPKERQSFPPAGQNEDLSNIKRYDEDHQIQMLLNLAAHAGAEKAVDTARKLSQTKQISDHALDEFHDRLTGPKE